MNAYLKIFIASLFLFIISPSLTFASGFRFQTNLKQGDRNSDVFELQKILNMATDTQISLSGSGSSGNETDYFGALTKAAMVRFQNKYKNDILTPSGLSFGTGFVGLLTRSKLNNLTVSNSQTKNADTTSFLVVENQKTLKNTDMMSGVVSPELMFKPLSSKDVSITSISAFEARPGDLVLIKASGVLDNSTIHLGDHYSTPTSLVDGVVTVSIPNITKGLYKVWLDNNNGSSKENSSFYLKISDQSKVRPVLTRAFPLNVSLKSVVTVEGSGFDLADNTIYSTLGVIKGVKSSQGKIVFNVADFPLLKTNSKSEPFDGMVVTYSVKNSNGTSVNFGRFTFSNTVAEREKSFFDKTVGFFDVVFAKIYTVNKAFAYGSTFDGGEIDSIKEMCTCSGSMDIKFKSYVDSQTHEYIYQPGVTTLYQNYNLFSSSGYFLTTIYPFGICLVEEGEDCNTEGDPEGTLNLVGTS